MTYSRVTVREVIAALTVAVTFEVVDGFVLAMDFLDDFDDFRPARDRTPFSRDEVAMWLSVEILDIDLDQIAATVDALEALRKEVEQRVA